MTYTEHLLTILAEECAEVAQRASKALRFGLEEIQPGQTLTNAQRIMEEYDDLRAVVELCSVRGMMPMPDDWRVKAKQQKIDQYLRYSQQQGTLTETKG